MAFAQSIKNNFPGFGSPSNYGYATQVLAGTSTLVIAATTTTPSAGGTPFNQNGGPAPTQGKWRARSNTVNAATTTSLKITVTDGTTTLVIANIPVTAAGDGIDLSGEFTTDLKITSISFIFTLAGASTVETVECEVALT